MLRKNHKRVPMLGNNELDLMTLPRERVSVMPLHTLLNCPYATVGAIGARWYMPERKTSDIDLLIPPDECAAARRSLESHGGKKAYALNFLHPTLGLTGERWHVLGEMPIDLLWSDHEWCESAITEAKRDELGVWYAPLWAIVVMKRDASRSRDQGDIANTLGLASDYTLKEVREIGARLLPDQTGDLEEYIYFGRFDVGREVDS